LAFVVECDGWKSSSPLQQLSKIHQVALSMSINKYFKDFEALHAFKPKA